MLVKSWFQNRIRNALSGDWRAFSFCFYSLFVFGPAIAGGPAQVDSLSSPSRAHLAQLACSSSPRAPSLFWALAQRSSSSRASPTKQLPLCLCSAGPVCQSVSVADAADPHVRPIPYLRIGQEPQLTLDPPRAREPRMLGAIKGLAPAYRTSLLTLGGAAATSHGLPAAAIAAINRSLSHRRRSPPLQRPRRRGPTPSSARR